MSTAKTTSAIHQQNYFWRLIDIARALSSTKDIGNLCERILAEAQQLSGADGGSILLLRDVGVKAYLEFIIIKNKSLGIVRQAPSELKKFQNIPLYDAEGRPNDKNIVSFCALNNRTVNIEDAYSAKFFDFQGTKAFDKNTGYRTESVLTVALNNHDGEIIGVLQLLNAIDPADGKICRFQPEVQYIVEALSSLVALSIENQMLLREHRDLLVRLSTEPTTIRLFERIVREAQSITFAEGGTLYLLSGEDNKSCLEFAVAKNDALGLFFTSDGKKDSSLRPIALYKQNGSKNLSNVATFAALKKKTVNIQNVYAADSFDFSGTLSFDVEHNYQSHSFLTVPLLNHDNDVIGVLQLVNARDPVTGQVVAFSPQIESIIEALAAYAAIALNNQILLAGHKELLDAFVKCIAQAIDAKSHHTAAHCQRVPSIVLSLAEAACRNEGPLKEFQLNEDEWYELKVAAWMHDCGKLSTPDSVLNKATKLQTIRDGIEAVQLRLQILQQQIELNFMRLKSCTAWHSLWIAMQYFYQTSQLELDIIFLTQANIGGESMRSEDKERVREIGKRLWKNHDGSMKTILSQEEIDFLCIERGTLSQDERQSINNHIVVTIEMLESLPFPKTLTRVPEYAGGHHERVDGKGFPRGLTREQMSWPARMMAIADIFEALTAPERPYKAPMPISQALGILKRMRDDRHIDPDLYHVFITAEVWKKYAFEFLTPEQLDLTEASAFL